MRPEHIFSNVEKRQSSFKCAESREAESGHIPQSLGALGPEPPARDGGAGLVPSTRRGCVVGSLTLGGVPFSQLGCGEEGGADAAALQGFHVDFSRQRSLWRGTRPSGEVEWWALSDTSCSSRIQRGPQRFSGA